MKLKMQCGVSPSSGYSTYIHYHVMSLLAFRRKPQTQTLCPYDVTTLCAHFQFKLKSFRRPPEMSLTSRFTCLLIYNFYIKYLLLIIFAWNGKKLCALQLCNWFEKWQVGDKLGIWSPLSNCHPFFIPYMHVLHVFCYFCALLISIL